MKQINRRSFIRKGLVMGGLAMGTAVIHPIKLSGNFLYAPPDIYSASGTDIWDALKRLLDSAGGINKFIKQGQVVGMLVNSPWKHPGFFTNLDIPLAMAGLCLEAGASRIVCFKPVPSGYWEKSNYFEKEQATLASITYSEDRVEVQIGGGKELKKASVFKDFMEVDVFVNIPVAKHHAGTVFSGMLKNLMGVSSSDTNRHMHSPDGEYTYAKKEYLSQCIADLNLLRKPDLCIMDAIECGLSNGPRGPSDTIKPNKILLSTDPVAMDAYAADLAGFDQEDILTTAYAGKLGIGKSDLNSVSILDLG